MWHLMQCSWEHRHDKCPSVYGRFDLSYNGTEPPKLLEFNADTPTTLIETAVVQWYWLQDKFPEYDQFNCMHEKLIEQWQRIKEQYGLAGMEDNNGEPMLLYFTSVKDSEEDMRTVLYMRDTAIQAGIPCAEYLPIEDIGFNEELESFVDLENRPIRYLFKLYPYEWISNEEFGHQLDCYCDGKPTTIQEQLSNGQRTAKITLIEPPWKMILSNKCILPILWEMFPNHPNLLPSYFSDEVFKTTNNLNYVKKHIMGREGLNITMIENGDIKMETPGPYNDLFSATSKTSIVATTPVQHLLQETKQEQPPQQQQQEQQHHDEEQSHLFVYQQLHLLPNFDGFYPMTGSWVINGEPVAVGFREDVTPITGNLSFYVPHRMEVKLSSEGEDEAQ